MKTRAPLATACKRYEEDLVLHYYGENNQSQRLELEHHLADCSSCRGFLDDLRTLLPQVAPMEEMPQSFWDRYYRETVAKIAEYDARRFSWRSFFAPMQSWMVPAAGTVAAAVLVVGLMFGKDNLKLFIEPRVERIPQEILADKNQLEFFQAMDMIEALGRLEAQDEPKSDATQNDRSRAELRGQTV
jgi:hypothetical protein